MSRRRRTLETKNLKRKPTFGTQNADVSNDYSNTLPVVASDERPPTHDANQHRHTDTGACSIRTHVEQSGDNTLDSAARILGHSVTSVLR